MLTGRPPGQQRAAYWASRAASAAGWAAYWASRAASAAGWAARRGSRAASVAGRERGSITVELVVLAPALVVLLLLVAAGARVVEVQGHIDGAARDAARAASIGRTYHEAWQLAQQAALADLGTSSWCAPGSVRASVPKGFPTVTGPLPGSGAQVMETVTCDVNMSPFAVFGFRASESFSGTAVAPLDPFVCRGITC